MPPPRVLVSYPLMESTSHHSLLLLNLAQVESLLLATPVTLMNVASVDQTLGFSERQIRTRDCVAQWNQGHDRRRRRMLRRHRGRALRSSMRGGSIADLQEEEPLLLPCFDDGEVACVWPSGDHPTGRVMRIENRFSWWEVLSFTSFHLPKYPRMSLQ